MGGGFALGVDFGTANTAAVLRDPHGDTHVLLFDGVPQLPSAVFVDGDTRLAGRDALHRGLSRPAALEPNPKRRVDDGTVLLGTEIDVADLIAVVLRRVHDEAVRIGPLDAVTLTCPATWGPVRRAVLHRAARTAGLPAPSTVEEPVAAAAHVGRIRGDGLPSGRPVLVYDLGAGTCDASLVRRTPDGIEVVASRGLDDAGGLDIDAAVVASIAAALRPGDPAWERLRRPTTAADLRARATLWDAVRAAKEHLSRTGSTTVYVPLLDEEVPLGREQLDALATPVLDRTVALVRGVLRGAGVAAADLATVALVGGSSRLPLVASMLHRELGVAPVLVEQPELAVAHGSLSDAIRPKPEPKAEPKPEPKPKAELKPEPVAAPEPEPEPEPAPVAGPAPVAVVGSEPEPTAGNRPLLVMAVTLVVLAALGALGHVLSRADDPSPPSTAASSPSPSPSGPRGDLVVQLDTRSGRGCEIVVTRTNTGGTLSYVGVPLRVEWRPVDGAPAPATTDLVLTRFDDPYAFDITGTVLTSYVLDASMRATGGGTATYRPGENYFRLFVWEGERGDLRISAVVDRYDATPETDETNNRAHVRVTVPSARVPGTRPVDCAASA